jgi:hypothetical protein
MMNIAARLVIALACNLPSYFTTTKGRNEWRLALNGLGGKPLIRRSFSVE